MFKKSYRLLLVLLLAALVFGGCSKKTKDAEAEPEPEIEEEIDEYEGMDINPLTGLYIDEQKAKLRPVAITINNLHKALPQSGIGQADIYYEVLAEGGITRIIAIFQDFDAEKIGPVRSARDYFTYFVLDNDAIYVHHGGSEGGYSAIYRRGINNIDGMADRCFWRDQTRVNQPGMYEHSSYTNAELLYETIEAKGYRTEVPAEYKGMFAFAEEEYELEGENTAGKIEITYSSYQVSQFYYDENDKVYYRHQSDLPHIDDLTGETLSVKNVIVQFADTYVIDSEGRRDVKLVGSGSGLYFTNGKAAEITWSKDSYDTPTKWFDAEGNILALNKGKTWICVYPANGSDIFFE